MSGTSALLLLVSYYPARLTLQALWQLYYTDQTDLLESGYPSSRHMYSLRCVHSQEQRYFLGTPMDMSPKIPYVLQENQEKILLPPSSPERLPQEIAYPAYI